MRKISDKSLLQILKRFANNPNDGKTAFKIADLCLHGNGLKENIENAFYYYELAAELGYVRAYNMVSWGYTMGWGTETNYKKGFEWAKKGAMVDDPSCTIGYAILLLQGLGCKKDVKTAAKYFSPMALAGDSSGQLGLGQCYLDKDFGIDYSKALYWIELAAKQKHFYALFKLGQMYEKGIGVKKDLTKAHDYYIKAKKAGSVDAAQRLKHWR